MANTKQVYIRGEVPFNLNEHNGVNDKLGQLNTPTMGLRITYSPSPTRYAPNAHGGQTAMYDFELQGIEAVNTTWLQTFVDDLKVSGATIREARVYDMDGQQTIRLKV